MNEKELKFVDQVLTMFVCVLLITLSRIVVVLFEPSWIIVSAGVLVSLICLSIILSILLM